MNSIDMHMHSSFSAYNKDTFMLRQIVRGERDISTSSSIADKGEPEHMLEAAAKKGLKAVSITDHWSVDVIELGRRKAQELGIEYINGIEIATLLEVDGIGREAHILGYFFRPEEKGLLRLCRDAEKTCASGADAFAEGLTYLNIDITREDIENEYPGNFSGWAIRRMLVNRGYARDKMEATMIQQKAVVYAIEKGSRYKFNKKNEILNAGDIIQILHNAGAIVFMAHPFWFSYPQQGGCPEKVIWGLIESMLALGVDGLEVYGCGNHNNRVMDFCKKRQIPACAGSDSHNVPSVLAASLINGEILESIKRYRQGLQPWA